VPIGVVEGIVVSAGFAHHPTAATSTLAGVRLKAGAGRVIAVLEPRSNTMKLGTHKAALAESLRGADRVFVVKRILPHLSDDSGFIKMFVEEAILSARLNHRSATASPALRGCRPPP